jgi:hypothetical protein
LTVDLPAPNGVDRGESSRVVPVAPLWCSYLLLLLLVASVVSAVAGDLTEAPIISGIMLLSVGLSSLNEDRSSIVMDSRQR